MRILKSLAPNSIVYFILSLCVTLGLLLGTSARPAYTLSSKHRYTSMSRQDVSRASIPSHSKGRPLKQYDIRAVLLKENKMASIDQSKSSLSEQSPHQRRQNTPADPNPTTAAAGLPSASWNRKRSSGSQSFNSIDAPAAAKPS